MSIEKTLQGGLVGCSALFLSLWTHSVMLRETLADGLVQHMKTVMSTSLIMCVGMSDLH